MDEVYTADQVARSCGITAQAVRDRARKRGVGRQLGRIWVFSASELAAMMTWPYRPGRRPGKGVEDGEALDSGSGV